jgi:hypothetical protein
MKTEGARTRGRTPREASDALGEAGATWNIKCMLLHVALARLEADELEAKGGRSTWP